jgi:hypothetical protein
LVKLQTDKLITKPMPSSSALPPVSPLCRVSLAGGFVGQGGGAGDQDHTEPLSIHHPLAQQLHTSREYMNTGTEI